MSRRLLENGDLRLLEDGSSVRLLEDGSGGGGGNRRRRTIFAGAGGMTIAKQSTAIIVTVGPVLDASGVAVTDGVVADFTISKNGGAPAALNGSATLTHRAVGFYSLSLTATDVNTVGTVEIIISDTVNCCPIKEIQVVETVVYDALFADAALGYVANAPVNVAQFGGTNGTFNSGIPAVNTTKFNGTNVTDASGRPEVNVTHFNGSTVTSASGRPEVNVTHLAGVTTGVANMDMVFNTDFNTAYDSANDKWAVQANVVSWAGTTATLTSGYPDVSLANFPAAQQQALIESMFTFNATADYAGATAGSLVKEIADNAGGSSLTLADIADAVWDEATAGHSTAGTTGKALTDAGSAGDPWGTSLPGAYSAGTAGYIIGTNLNGTITSRASQSSLDTLDDYVDTEVAALATELAKVPKSDGTATWNATALASINTQCDTALNDYDGPTNTEMVAAFTQIKGATWATTDTLEAIRDRGDAAWVTATGFSTHSAADVVTAIGTGSTLTALATQTSVNTIDDFLDTEIAAIKAKTDNLPSDPADASDIAASFVTVNGTLATISGYVDDIGVAGSGLTAIPWNTAWDAEVQSEVTDALNAALTEAYRSAGATGSVAQLLYEISAHLGRSAFASTTKTIYKLNNTTPAKTFTLDSATPTAIEETT